MRRFVEQFTESLTSRGLEKAGFCGAWLGSGREQLKGSPSAHADSLAGFRGGDYQALWETV
jgi:hypothetical protein